MLHSPEFAKYAPALAKLNSKHILEAAIEAGDLASIRGLLRKEGVADSLKKILCLVQTINRNIHGTDAERSAIRYKFIAMRLWGGFSFVFFTLNPNEWGSPLTLRFRGPYSEELRSFSL